MLWFYYVQKNFVDFEIVALYFPGLQFVLVQEITKFIKWKYSFSDADPGPEVMIEGKLQFHYDCF